MNQHTAADFSMLMGAFRVPVKEVDTYIDVFGRLRGYPRDMTLFTGVDRYKRLFVHIPVAVEFHDGLVVYKNLLIYQPEFNIDTFIVSASIDYEVSWDALLKQDRFGTEMDFLKLACLLAGQRVTIYEDRATEKGRTVIDSPDKYITLTLYNQK